MPALSDPRFETFAQHYAINRNAAQAARAAGLSDGYHPPTVLKKHAVATRIRELWGEASEAAGVTPEMVFQQMRRFAFQDVRGLYDENGMLKPIHELDDDMAAAITGIDVETRYDRDGAEEDGTPNFKPVNTIKIRRVDPMPALTLFAKHFKLVDTEGEGVNALAAALADRLQAGRRRAYGAPPARHSQDVEDARIITPAPIASQPQETSDEQLW